MRLIMIGHFAGGAMNGTREKAPTNRPAHPRPAIARPTIRAGELGAAPQTAEPTRKRTMEML